MGPEFETAYKTRAVVVASAGSRCVYIKGLPAALSRETWWGSCVLY